MMVINMLCHDDLAAGIRLHQRIGKAPVKKLPTVIAGDILQMQRISALANNFLSPAADTGRHHKKKQQQLFHGNSRLLYHLAAINIRQAAVWKTPRKAATGFSGAGNRTGQRSL